MGLVPMLASGPGPLVSFQAVEYVLKHVATDGPVDRVVLMILAHYARGDAMALADGRKGWEAWPALSTIAELADVGDVRYVRRALRRLEKSGAIETTTGGGRARPSRYRILVQTRARMTPVNEGETRARMTRVKDDGNPCANDPGLEGETRARTVPKPVRESPGEQVVSTYVDKGFTDTHAVEDAKARHPSGDRVAYDAARVRDALRILTEQHLAAHPASSEQPWTFDLRREHVRTKWERSLTACAEREPKWTGEQLAAHVVNAPVLRSVPDPALNAKGIADVRAQMGWTRGKEGDD